MGQVARPRLGMACGLILSLGTYHHLIGIDGIMG